MTTEKKVLLKDATGPQMRAFAQTHLGMEFRHNEPNEKVRAAIAQAWAKDEIIVVEEEPQAKKASTQREPGPVADKVRLIVQRTEEAGGDEPVPVGVNGRIMLIPRGEEVEIPVPYFEVWKNAIRYIYDANKEGGLNPVPRQVPAYPFQRLA